MNVLETAAELDPIKFASVFWPDVRFYNKQREILYSVQDNKETLVVAGNGLGKDFIAGFIAVWYFLHPLETRIIATSVADHHLRVVWGEIMRFITTSKYPLRVEDGGPLRVLDRDIYKIKGSTNGEICPISYLRRMVSMRGEGLAGHHASRTLAIMDEASGISDESKVQMDGWTKRYLIFGNPNQCGNFFRRAEKEGDVLV